MKSSTCFETKGSFSGGRCYIREWYNMFYVNHYKQSCTCIILSQCTVQKTKKKTVSHLTISNHHYNILPINASFFMLSFFSNFRNTLKPATYDHWLVSAVGFHSKQVTRGNILKRLSYFSTTNILDRSSFKGELPATSWPQYFVRCLSVCINAFSTIVTTTLAYLQVPIRYAKDDHDGHKNYSY